MYVTKRIILDVYSSCIVFVPVPSQPPQGVQATPLSSTGILVLWSPPPFFALNGILQGYKIIYRPVTEDEGKHLVLVHVV